MGRDSGSYREVEIGQKIDGGVQSWPRKSAGNMKIFVYDQCTKPTCTIEWRCDDNADLEAIQHGINSLLQNKTVKLSSKISECKQAEAF